MLPESSAEGLALEADASAPLAAEAPDPGADSSRDERARDYRVTRVPVAQESARAGAVVASLGGRDFASMEAVYVVDASGSFAGAIRLPDLLRAPREHRIAQVLDRDYPRVSPGHDQEHVAEAALRGRATSVAVVDDGGRLIGAVTALSLLDILRREHVEDLHRLAGIAREQVRDLDALEAPPVRRARHRLPWLLVGLAGSMLAAYVVSGFESVLRRNLSIAFFVPAIVYLADAIGTQTEAIAVRGLSLSRLSLRQLLFDELRTGLMIGLCLGALALPVTALGFGDWRLGVSVSVAIVASGAVATTIGLLLPWLLLRMGSDPAFGSGPVATIIQDVLSLLIYFAITTFMMG